MPTAKSLLTFLALSSPSISSLIPRQSCGEGAQTVCYGSPSGTPQNIDPEDLSYLAATLRYNAQAHLSTTKEPQFFTMPPNNNFQCEEWTIAQEGTVMLLAKHTSARLNTTVLTEDIANTLDGGANPSAAQKKSSPLGACGKNGGQMGVVYNQTRAEYNTPAYKNSKATPSGLVLKVLHAP
ncbi:hypothetical protein QBC37DRAFT_462305 [Rhypophila decipiens]|uniref:Uncharacterized protein n=1 Tax=Rhypophila decipiens TaxID=261697 RepID=A0AAN6YA78_9PEZI|nr:hypothetical protein QBC37DRAFT_462305 [Rhypophila decipiens]